MSFEPFGWRRNWNTVANLDATSAGAFNTRPRTSRGFTGHEQVDNLSRHGGCERGQRHGGRR